MNRSRAKRILGMTVPQLLILGCLFLCICGTVSGGYWALNAIVASAYAIPDLPGLGTPATPLPTAIPSATPIPSITPSPTPITYESLIPEGWEQFKSGDAPGMEIWLPPSYRALTERLVQVHKMSYVSFPEVESQDGAELILHLADMERGSYALYTTFLMSKQPLPAADLDKAIDLKFANMMLAASLVERNEFEIGNYPARKVVFDTNRNGVNAGLVVYLIQDEGTAWYLGFTTSYNELYPRMPIFDQIARTFRVRR